VEETGTADIVKVTISVVEQEFDERLANVYADFTSRLSEEEKASIGVVDPAALADEEDAEDAGIPDSYIASLTRELRIYIEIPSSLPEERRAAIHNYVVSISKPGLIIDGQHRVFGAKNGSPVGVDRSIRGVQIERMLGNSRVMMGASAANSPASRGPSTLGNRCSIP
jgi:hypothetical protein